MSGRTSRRRRTGKSTKQTAKRMFIKGFLQSFFIVLILMGAGILGYQVTMRLWMVEPKMTQVKGPEPTEAPITVPSVDEVSKNLIFCYDNDTHIISKLVLEVFHCEDKQITYVTIPMSTQFTMSDILYKKLIAVQPSIPQMMRLSTMIRYFDENVIFDYGVLMVEDMLELDISYYTVIPTVLYQSVFEEKSIPDQIKVAGLLSEIEESEAKFVTAEVFKKDYIKRLDKLDQIEQIRTYMQELYKEVKSNLSLVERMNYLESYGKTALSDISFTRIAGYDRNSGFVLDKDITGQQLMGLKAK